jgi:hypothetical protein
VAAWGVYGRGSRLFRRQRSNRLYVYDNRIIEIHHREKSVYALYRLDGCAFPEAGYYYIELYCEEEFVDDQVIRVLRS